MAVKNGIICSIADCNNSFVHHEGDAADQKPISGEAERVQITNYFIVHLGADVNEATAVCSHYSLGTIAMQYKILKSCQVISNCEVINNSREI